MKVPLISRAELLRLAGIASTRSGDIEPRGIGRRRFLQYGAGAVGAAALPLRRAAAGTLFWEADGARAVVLRDRHHTYWRVTADVLGPTGRLSFGEGREALWLELIGGMVLGGQPIQARVELRHLGTWHLSLAASYLRQPATASLHGWLTGVEQLTAPARVIGAITFPRLGELSLGQGSVATAPDWLLTYRGSDIGRVRLTGGLRATADDVQLRASATPITTALDATELHVALPEAAITVPTKGFRIGGDAVSFQSNARGSLLLTRPHGSVETASAFIRPVGDNRHIVARLIVSHPASLKPELSFDQFVLGIRRNGSDEHRVLFAGVDAPGAWFPGKVLSAHVAGPEWGVAAEVSLGAQGAAASKRLTANALRTALPGADVAELIPETGGASLDAFVTERGKIGSSLPLDPYRLRVRRAVDMLDLEFSFVNVSLWRTRKEMWLQSTDERKSSLIRVHFPPQVMGDEVYFVQRDLKGGRPSIDPNDVHWKEWPTPFNGMPAGLARDEARRKYIAEVVLKQDEGTNPINEFANRPISQLKPRTYAAGRSRLVFTSPSGARFRRAWSLEALLDWNGLKARVHPRAAPPDTPWLYQATLAALPLEPPTINQTSLEAPFGFQLSPLADPDCVVQNAVNESQTATLTWYTTRVSKDAQQGLSSELWHTRLATLRSRAIWARGFVPEAFNGRFAGPGNTNVLHPPHKPENDGRRLTFDDRDRHEIVALSSVFGLTAVPGSAGVIKPPQPNLPTLFAPGALDTDRLFALSSVGASFRLKANWDPPLPLPDGTNHDPWPALTIESLRSRHVWGAEDFGRVVYRGFLFPLGVRVSLVKLTERQFEFDPLDSQMKAPKLQRLFIILPKKVKFYPAVRQPHAGRNSDLVSIEFLVERTPDLLPPDEGKTGLEPSTPEPCPDEPTEDQPLHCWLQDLFWPQIAPAQYFSFPFLASDQGNRTTLREGPQLFVSNFLAYRPRVMARIAAYYNDLEKNQAAQPRRTLVVGGQRVGYAPPGRTAVRRAETAFETSHIVLRACLTPFDPKSIAIASIAAGNPATITTAAPHNLSSGQTVLIAGTTTTPAINARHIVTKVSDTTVTIAVEVKAGQSTAGGTMVLVEEDGAQAAAATTGVWTAATLEELQSAAQPPFYPCLESAHVRVPAIEHMAGSSSPATVIGYDDIYRDHGFVADRNQIEVFARLKRPVAFNVGTNNSNVGGVAAPTTEIVALSRTAGLIGGRSVPADTQSQTDRASTSASDSDSVRQLQNGRFDPASMFATSVGDAKLLGTIRLADVIRVAVSQLSSVPRFVDEAVFEGVEAIRTLFCTQGTPRVIAMLTVLSDAINALPDSAGRRLLRARVDALQRAASDVQNSCVNQDTAGVASGIAVFVRLGQDFINDARGVADNPATLLPDAVVQTMSAIQAALAPFLPPFNPADQLRKALAEFLLAVLNEQIDAAAQDALTAIHNIQQEYQPRILATWRAISELRKRLREDAANAEANLVARFNEVAQTVSAHLDELLVLEQAIKSSLCKTAAETIANAANDHFGTLSSATVTAIDGLVVRLDDASRSIFRIANSQSVPSEVRARAVAIHEQGRVLAESVIAALKRLRNAVTLPTTTELNDLCNALWDGAVGAEAVRALAQVKTVVLQTLSPSEVVRGIRPLHDFLDRTLAALPEPVVTAAVSPSDDFAELRRHVSDLLSAVADLRTGAVNILTRPALGETLPVAIDNRIKRSADLVAKVKALSFSARLNDILDQLLETASREWRALVTATSDEVLERVALAEEMLCRRVVDALLPGALHGFDAITRWYGDWERAANGLVAAPIRTVLDAAFQALPDATELQTMPLSLLAQSLRNDLADLRDAVGRARVAVNQTPLTADGLKLLADVGTRAEALVRRVLDDLSRGDLSQLVSLDPVLNEFETLLRAITPIRRAFRYEWATALQAFPSTAGAEVFIPEGGGSEANLAIRSAVEVSLAPGGIDTKTQLFGEIRKFKLVLIPGFRLLAVSFDHVQFHTENGGAPAYDVKIAGVAFLGPFEFVSALGSLLDKGGNGPYLRISTDPPAIEAGFRFGAEIVSFGAFTLQNVRVSLAFRLPLNSQPATFAFAFASRAKPFLLSAGIYGGGGFLALNATPTKLVSVEGAFEFGAVTAIKFGPLDARGRIVAGLYFRIASSNSALAGYVLATGTGRIAWFGISVLLRVEVESDGANASGAASFEVSFEIGAFVKLTFGFTAGYTFAGSGSPSAARARAVTDGGRVAALPALGGRAAPTPACGAIPEPRESKPCPAKDITWWKTRDRYIPKAMRH